MRLKERKVEQVVLFSDVKEPEVEQVVLFPCESTIVHFTNSHKERGSNMHG
jgi:hypothetical protein